MCVLLVGGAEWACRDLLYSLRPLILALGLWGGRREEEREERGGREGGREERGGREGGEERGGREGGREEREREHKGVWSILTGFHLGVGGSGGAFVPS